MVYLFGEEGPSSEAADTGSAVHAAIAAWHKQGQDDGKAIQALQESEARFKKANMPEAANLFLYYIADKANQEAKFATDASGQPLVEYHGVIEISPAKSDPTQAPIVIVGTLDQVRLTNAGPAVYDIKTSKWPPAQQLDNYIYQLATYAIIASTVLRDTCRMGGLICLRHKQQHWEYPHRFHDIAPLIDGIRNEVARVRSGDVHASPGTYCSYCPAHSTSQCLPILRSISDSNHRIKPLEVVT